MSRRTVYRAHRCPLRPNPRITGEPGDVRELREYLVSRRKTKNLEEKKVQQYHLEGNA